MHSGGMSATTSQPAGQASDSPGHAQRNFFIFFALAQWGLSEASEALVHGSMDCLRLDVGSLAVVKYLIPVSHLGRLHCLQEAKVGTLLDFLEKPKALRDVNLAERVSQPAQKISAAR